MGRWTVYQSAGLSGMGRESDWIGEGERESIEGGGDQTWQNGSEFSDPTRPNFLTRSKNRLTRDPTRVFCESTRPDS